MIIDDFDPSHSDQLTFELSNIFSKENNGSKQNASYQDFATPSKLDSEVETILNSIKDDVMTSIKKTKYFTKPNKGTNND